MNTTADKASAAYGGRELWTSARTIEAEVSAQGWAFTLKRRPFFQHAHIKLDVTRPFVRLTPIGKDPQISGVLDGHTVRLADQAGKIVAERPNARLPHSA